VHLGCAGTHEAKGRVTPVTSAVLSCLGNAHPGMAGCCHNVDFLYLKELLNFLNAFLLCFIDYISLLEKWVIDVGLLRCLHANSLLTLSFSSAIKIHPSYLFLCFA